MLNPGVAQSRQDWDWEIHPLETTDDGSHPQSLKLSAKRDLSQHKDWRKPYGMPQAMVPLSDVRY